MFYAKLRDKNGVKTTIELKKKLDFVKNGPINSPTDIKPKLQNHQNNHLKTQQDCIIIAQ